MTSYIHTSVECLWFQLLPMARLSCHREAVSSLHLFPRRDLQKRFCRMYLQGIYIRYSLSLQGEMDLIVFGLTDRKVFAHQVSTIVILFWVISIIVSRTGRLIKIITSSAYPTTLHTRSSNSSFTTRLAHFTSCHLSITSRPNLNGIVLNLDIQSYLWRSQTDV